MSIFHRRLHNNYNGDRSLFLGWSFLSRGISRFSLQHFFLLESLSLFSTLSSILHLHTAGFSLVSQHLSSGLLCLLLVLEHVSLCLEIELVIQVSVDFLRLPVSLEKPPQNSHSLHPQILLTCSGISCSLPLSKATVTSFPPGLLVGSNSGSGMDSNRLLDHETILDQLPDIGSRVSVGNLVDLVWVKP